MLQHKVNQMLFSSPFLLVALIYLCLPLCTESCECQTNNTLHLNITENDGHGSTIIINFLEGYPNNYFIVDFWDSSDSDRETKFYEYFRLENTLSTIGSIDREEIAKGLGDPYSPVRFEFEITYYDYDDIEEQDCKCVTLDVIDLDDNTPTFGTEQKVVMFHEDNTEVGRKVDIPIAVDDDEAGNGTSVYELVDESGKFELVYNYYSGTPRVKALSLKHNSPLDYEQQSSYQLQLHAREDNESPDEDVLIILVMVIDSCDEPVTFTTSRYTPSVIEEMGDIPIVKVEATDDDNRTNCPLTYEITKACRRETNHHTSNCENIAIQPLFTLDLESGQLTLLEELDRESYSEYEVTIRASDGQHSTATAMVVISVEDINDNPPVVNTVGLFTTIPEDQLPGPTALGVVTVTDDDAGENGTTTVYLLDNSTGIREESQTFRLIKRNEIEYRFVLNRSLDFETQREFSLIIRAQDHGINPHSVEIHKLIQILDINDHPPEFVNLPTVKNISENSVNTTVIKVEARDRDEGVVHAIITYELPESNATYPYQHLFQIEQETGRILVGDVVLDYETVTSYTILVVARNSESDEHLSSSAELTILLKNLNDERPQITVNPIRVNETTESGETIGQVIATDADNLAPLTYTLRTYTSIFSISGDGTISLEGHLDYETVTSYPVTVEVSDGNHTSEATVTIDVLPVNDEIPAFNHNGPYMAMIVEEGEKIKSVINVTATDADNPPQDLRYSIEDGIHRERFSISPSGEISTTQSLDREDTPNYTLWIKANDGKFDSDLKEVIINVTDINDHTPEFVGDPYNFYIEERNTPYQFVGHVSVLSLDEGINQMVRFNLSDYSLFQINENTGEIKTNNRVFDYETDPSHIELTVIVTDLGSPPNMNMTTVNVEIVDVNDNGPEFTQSEYDFILREDYPTGQVFGRVVAEDMDGIGNNNTIYSFSEDTDAEGFRIEESTGELSLVSSLDFETTNMTAFKVIATDAGRRDLQSLPTTVVITITDARDLNLTFPDDFVPHFSVLENIEANYTITSLEVTDHMSNSIDRLIYSLTTENDEQSPYFGLRKEGHTAVIYTLTHTINREANDIGDDKTYRLKLNVSDPDTTPDSYGYIVSYLTIEILDENDNRPKLMTDSTVFSVFENGNAGEVVTGTIEVMDPDAGNNGTIRLSIESIVPFNVTHKVQNDGRQFAVIKVVSPLDRETQSTYNFFLRAADMGTPSSYTTIEITVDVIDINDNYPDFDQEEYTFDVPENSDLFVIDTVHATDPDEGTNSVTRYEVVPGHELVAIHDVFLLVEDTGDIRLLKSLDRETKCEYTFNVRALDGGNQADTATVVVTVTDVNEFQPAFINSSFTTTIPENIPTGVPFTSLIAEDQDKAPNANVRYALADGSLSEIFCLNSETGGISICDSDPSRSCKFLDVIDYERTNEYKVGIIAYDNGEPRKYSNVTLTVQITDVNEHPPVFDVSRLSITMSENTAVGDIVLEIQAYDRDLPDNLQYSFVHEHPGTHFHWDDENKALILSSPVDYITTPTLAVRLRADDGEKHNEIEIFVTVLNENNHPPVFETQDSTISVSESAEEESEIFRVHAMDMDNATNDAVIYSISDGNIGNTFYINPKTGVLYIAQALDYETEPSYSLTIIATDTGIPALVSEPLTLTIQIINQNDEVPIFEEREYTFSLTEENTAMTEVGRVSAQDRDEGSFDIVVYSIVEEGEYPGFFSIDKSSGKISAIKTVDREVIDEFQLMVEARDNENPALKDTVSVVVVVSDINDNGPTFTQNYFDFYISSDHDISQTVGTITAIDRDHGENASFTYGIVTQDPDLEISLSDNGTVTLVATIPDNYQASYSFEVKVSSNVLGDTRSDSATILIIVETDTDHNPRFTEQVYEEHVPESMDVGDLVFDASEVVTDPDGTSQLEYLFVGSYNQFALDSESGRLTLQESLNYEETDSYEIQIQVIDTFSSRRRTATATVRVIVEDRNDHAPVFTQVPTNIILSPVPYTNIELFKVKARDDDIGDQGTVEYSIVQQSSNTFDIDTKTGAVTNRVNLVANDTYVFVIRAFDDGFPLMSSNATVHIHIADQTNSPLFPNGDTAIEISMPEDRDFETDPVIREFSTTPTADSYHLVYSNASKDMFGIEMSNLVLKSQLDYETASQYLLIIEARSINSNGMRLSSFLLVNIFVTDVNDKRPQFLPLTTQEVSESVSTSTLLFTVEAKDDDSGQNADISYVISDGNFNNTFDIHRTMGVVKLVKPLDREIRASYNLTIRATDSGANPLQNETTVLIEVVDVNDNPPTFSHANYSISVFEHPHTDIGDVIMQIVAKDKDSTPSVSYNLQLLEGTYDGNLRYPALDTFDIDFDTGNITTHRRLDREEVDRYFIRIEARDSIHTAVANLTVHVLDMNDHSPEFPNRPDDIIVYELEPVNSEVLGQQLVTDRDIGQNSIVKYYLTDGWPHGDFKIDPWTGVIRIARTFSFDRDYNNEFEGTVVAVDQGYPARTGTMRVKVTIQDVNNFPPELADSHFKFDVAYNDSKNTPIATFNGTDEHDEIFNSVTLLKIPNYYSDAKNLFELSTTTTIDFSFSAELKLREDAASYVGDYNFRIEAKQERGLPICPQYIQATYAHVRVIIHPPNGNSPVFDLLTITAEIEESATVGYELFISDLIATDADGDNIFYSILSSENLPFAISEPSSPTITTTALLDADLLSTSEYTLMVRAKDSGFPAKSTDVTLVIRVKDVNDLPPEFENKSYNGWVAENSAEGTLILTVSAIDRDREISDTIDYSIEYSDNCDANCLPFDIRPSGAIVTTSKQIDYEKTQSYTFLVKASDGLFASNVSVTIDVSGVNEDRPKFEKKVFEFTVPGGKANGEVVGTVKATDSDIGMEGDLRYSFVDTIEEDYNIFIIDEKSGEVSLNLGTTEQTVKSVRKRSVDELEDNMIISRVVMVRDLGVSPMNDTAEVIITIDKGYFRPIEMTKPRETDPTIIIIVVTAVVAAIIVFIAIFVCALICQRHHSQNKKFKVEEAQMNGTGRCGTEMSERYCRNENGTPLDGKSSKTKLHTGNSASGSEHSYTADDEMDSGNEGANRFSGHSPSLSNKPPRNNSPHVRSTSDLASSVGTDALHSQANEHPYTKAQLVKIYAANEDLLDDNVSHDSVRMFGSEGGGEADGDYDINNLINQKINDLEDDEESNAMMDDDASTTYSKGRGMTLAGSAGNLDLLPAEETEDPLYYTKGWIPPSGKPIDETIDEITSRFASQEAPLPRRNVYEMGGYSHSQGPSLYNPSATQESFIGIQPPPKLYHHHHHPHYYREDKNERLARDHEHDRPRYTPRSNHRYGSASVLPANPGYLQGHRQHYHSQELAPPYSKYSPYIPGVRRPMGHNHAYMTPPEGTDGTVTPQTALNGDYNYLSSSSTSLTSTNVSGNLSQPSRRPQMYN